MIPHTSSVAGELIGIVAGAAILLVFALTFVLPNRARRLPGSEGHREDETGEHEVVRPDGYIDSFSRVIEEAGGSLPPLIRLFLPGILLWWLVYLILNWAP